MIKRFAIYGLLTGLLLTPSVQAKCTSAAIHLPETVTLQGYSTPALLNGFGIRTKLVWDIYVAALYLPEPSQDPDAILAMDGPRRLSIYFAHDVPKEKLVEGWQDGFVKNNTPDALEKLQQRLDESYEYLTDMVEGDVIYLDQHPDKGTLLWINNKLTHTINGTDYFNAVLKIWIGQTPAQKPLKDCLLRLKPATE